MCSAFFRNVFYFKTRKATDFKLVRVNCCEINQLTSKYQMDFSGKTCKNRSRTEKSEYHHRILHVRNSLGTRFQLKLTILNFWTKLTQKGYLKSKKMKINIEFYIFELVHVLNLSFNKQF